MATIKKSPTDSSKIGTLFRKKNYQQQQVSELDEQTRQLIERGSDSRSGARITLLPDKTSRVIEQKHMEDPKLKKLVETLTGWMNDTLCAERIVVKDIFQDFSDGHLLAILFQKLSGIDMGHLTSFTLVLDLQLEKLDKILEIIQKELVLPEPNSQWNSQRNFVSSGNDAGSLSVIHLGDICATLHLLVTLKRFYASDLRLPGNVAITLYIVTTTEKNLETKVQVEQITDEEEDSQQTDGVDAFDTLFQFAPEKLDIVIKTLLSFTNKYLACMNIEITNIEEQLNDGTNLITLLGLLGGYYVPVHLYHHKPINKDDRLHNMKLVVDLLADIDIDTSRIRAEDAVALDSKTLLRILYALFTKYKTGA